MKPNNSDDEKCLVNPDKKNTNKVVDLAGNNQYLVQDQSKKNHIHNRVIEDEDRFERRRFSLEPSNISYISAFHNGVAPDPELLFDAEHSEEAAELNVKLAFTSTRNFCIGLFMLFLMVVPCSIIGPLTVGLPAKDVFIQASWRFQGCTIVIIPVMMAYYGYKGKEMSFWADHTYVILKRNAINSIFLFGWNLGFILGCSMTITSHADIMYSSSGVFIFVFSILTWQKVYKMEWFGFFLYAVGVYFMFTDPFATKTGMEGQSYLGDLLAFWGAGWCAVFNIINNEFSEGLHPIVMMGQTFVIISIYQLFVFPFFTDPWLFFSFDPNYGAFGWLVDMKSLFLVLVINAPITGLLGNIGFYTSYFYFPMQVIAGSMLIEPFFAQIVGIALGQDEVPGIKTLIGCITITIGFAIIVQYGAEDRVIEQEERRFSLKQVTEHKEYAKLD